MWVLLDYYGLSFRLAILLGQLDTEGEGISYLQNVRKYSSIDLVSHRRHLESNTWLLFLQAWCKFYENARSFILVPPTVVNTQCLNSVHLCEAPGAFITSLNHFLKLHNPGIEVCIQTHQNTPSPPKCCRVYLEELVGKEITSFTN